MPLRALIASGATLFGVGTVKAMTHAKSADPMAAYWCRTPGVESADAAGLFAGHCWGCPVAALGAALLVAGLFVAIRRTRAALELSAHPV